MIGISGKRLWLGVGVAAVAAFATTGAIAVSGGGTITTIAGTGSFATGGGFSGDGGPATRAQLDLPREVAVDRRGNVYISDYRNNRVRKVNLKGTISTFAGGRAGDELQKGGGPHGLVVDGKGNVLIALEFGEVLKVNPGGAITRIAGRSPDDVCGAPTPIPCGTDGGPATSAPLLGPEGVAVDARGNVYIADGDGHRVRKVSPNGIISTIAGTGRFGFSGDRGAATSARLHTPMDVAVDGKGNLYIADSVNNRVRKVSRGGRITTFAGTGKPGSSGDGGRATSARIYMPKGLAVDGKGNVYIVESGRVRKVSPDGTIRAFAGGGTTTGFGDGGPATRAKLSYPIGVEVDRRGNVYIADFGDHRVRKVRP